jgi:GAF domain-containing protein
MMNRASTSKARLQDLLTREISPEQFYREYLGELMGAVPVIKGCHLWLLQGQEFIPLGGSNRDEILFDKDSNQRAFVLEKIKECASGQASVFVPAGEAGNNCGFVLAFTPLMHGSGGGAVQGAQVAWLSTPPPAGLGQFLDDCGRSAAQMARAQKLESMSGIADTLQSMAAFLDELSASRDLKSASVAVVNRAREITGCDRCALVVIRSPGNPAVEAVSNVPAPDPRSSISRTILQLAENALATGLPVGYRKANEKTGEKGDLSDYFFHSKMEEVLVVGVPGPGGGTQAMLLLESASLGFFTPERHRTSVSIATHSAGALARTLDYEHLPLRRISEAVARWRRLPGGERRGKIIRKSWIPGLVLLAVLLYPARYSLHGDASVQPVRRAFAVAEVPGRIAEILVTDGEPVEALTPLARIDDSEARKQRDIAAQEEMRLMAEAHGSVSGVGGSGSGVAELALRKARLEREYHEDRLERHIVRSPIAGTVMAPSLSTLLGGVLAQGDRFAMVGDSSAWELVVRLDEPDAALLAGRLGRGETVPVTYVLSAFPGGSMRAEVVGSSSVSASAEVVAGRNVFRVDVPLEVSRAQDGIFRNGYSGRARFDLGRRPLVFTATRRFLNWLRLHVLF